MVRGWGVARGSVQYYNELAQNAEAVRADHTFS